MDRISSAVNLQVPNSFKTNHHLHHHKATPLSHHKNHHHHPSSTTKTTSTSSISSLPQKDNFTPLFTYHPQKRAPSPSSPSLSSLKPPPRPPPRASIHRSAASGYAAALLEISQSKNNLLKVEMDVRRILKVVFRSKNEQVKEFMNNELEEEKTKGEVLKNFIVKGKFDGHLVQLINMLIDKGNSVELVKDVLEEFIYVFHQLTFGFVHAPISRLAMPQTI